MKLFLSFILMAFSLSTFAQFSPQQRDRNEIKSLVETLRTIAESDLSCAMDDDCAVIPMGARACGGPSGAVIASVNNKYFSYVEYLAKLVTEKEREFNRQYNVISICSVKRLPTSACVSNTCTEVY